MYKMFMFFFVIIARFVQSENEDLLSKMSKYLIPLDVKDLDKKRYGAKSDGGYVIFKDLEYDGFYSYGIGTDISFEEELISAMPEDMTCHLFDHTIENFPSNNPRLIWHKEGVGPCIKDNIKSIRSQLKGNNDINKKSIFLKMDIEGSEWLTLLNISSKILKRFKQIVIEYHGICNDAWGVDLKTKVEVLKKIKKFFHVVHVHGNNCANANNVLLYDKNCLIPEVIEVTYLRKDKNNKTRKSKQKYPIKDLDYPNNPDLPDIELNTFLFHQSPD